MCAEGGGARQSHHAARLTAPPTPGWKNFQPLPASSPCSRSPARPCVQLALMTRQAAASAQYTSRVGRSGRESRYVMRLTPSRLSSAPLPTTPHAAAYAANPESGRLPGFSSNTRYDFRIKTSPSGIPR